MSPKVDDCANSLRIRLLILSQLARLSDLLSQQGHIEREDMADTVIIALVVKGLFWIHIMSKLT